MQLTLLGLHENQLTGTIPMEMASLTPLDTSTIGLMTRLTHLTLHSNQLTGTIPHGIEILTQLHILSISDKQLTGTIHQRWDIWYNSLIWVCLAIN